MIIELITEPTDGRLQQHLESTAGIGVRLYFPKTLFLEATLYCSPPLGLPI